MNHTVHGLRARRCPEESWLCQTGVAARDQWCAGFGRRCNGYGNEWQKSDGVLREGDCVYMGGVRCEVGAGRGGRFCDCWLQLRCSVRRGQGRPYGRALRHAVCRANEQASCAAGGSGCEGVTGQPGRSCA